MNGVCCKKRNEKWSISLPKSRANTVARTDLIQPEVVSWASSALAGKARTPPVYRSSLRHAAAWDELTFKVPFGIDEEGSLHA